MDDLGIGGQLIVPIISSSVGKAMDESNSKTHSTSSDHQARTNPPVLNH